MPRGSDIVIESIRCSREGVVGIATTRLTKSKLAVHEYYKVDYISQYDLFRICRIRTIAIRLSGNCPPTAAKIVRIPFATSFAPCWKEDGITIAPRRMLPSVSADSAHPRRADPMGTDAHAIQEPVQLLARQLDYGLLSARPTEAVFFEAPQQDPEPVRS